MKTTIKAILCAMLLAAALCGCGAKPGGAAEGDGTTLAGGYSKPRTPDADEKALFESLTDGLEGVKYKPLNVATQVVAGTNYRFVCQGRETARKGRKFDAVITIYKPLPGQGEPRVTSVERQRR